MSFPALAAKEIEDLVRQRRLLFHLLGTGILFSIVWFLMTATAGEGVRSVRTYMEVPFFLGPLLVGFLALAMAGDAVSRGRSDRTIHLLFTSPVTKTGYLAAMLVGHIVAFLAFAGFILLAATLVGTIAGAAALKLALLTVVGGLLPLFLVLDPLFIALGTTSRSARATLGVAATIVVVLWITSDVGPFGFILQTLPWWSPLSFWHPVDASLRVVTGLRDLGVVRFGEIAKLLGMAVAATVLAWAGFRRTEVGA